MSETVKPKRKRRCTPAAAPEKPVPDDRDAGELLRAALLAASLDPAHPEGVRKWCAALARDGRTHCD